MYRFRYDGPDPARPRKRTLREVRRARPYYSDLIDEVAEHGYNSDVHRITKRQLNRVANAIADLIIGYAAVKRWARAADFHHDPHEQVTLVYSLDVELAAINPQPRHSLDLFD